MRNANEMGLNQQDKSVVVDKPKSVDYRFYDGYTHHKVAVIGLGKAGLGTIQELLKIGVHPVDIVAVDAFDPYKFSIKPFFNDEPGLKKCFLKLALILGLS